jgi:23S rRNA (cytidine1920-2'-O)/16S rRNA (cytidine1409-2'-O)-methyltransferase
VEPAEKILINFERESSNAEAGLRPMPKSRLDQLLVARGLAQSRERARAMILAGDVTVGGRPAAKAGTLVEDTAAIALRQADHPWVGRGGIKLAHALETFHLDVKGRVALDIGASTGGFTDVLLERGALKVVALDVGRGQIDWRLRTDPRVVTIEGVNARRLRPEDLPADLRTFDLVTIDVSFISLRHVLPVVPALMRPDARIIALVKPQFEAGRDDVGPGGIVRDPAVHARVISEVTREAHQVGLERLALEPSPIEGAEGNREFLMLLRQNAGSEDPASI